MLNLFNHIAHWVRSNIRRENLLRSVSGLRVGNGYWADTSITHVRDQNNCGDIELLKTAEGLGERSHTKNLFSDDRRNWFEDYSINGG